MVDHASGPRKQAYSVAETEGLERRHHAGEAGDGASPRTGTRSEGDEGSYGGVPSEEGDEDGQQDQVEAAMVVNDPLAPLESAPRDRWYNAAIPFFMVAMSTFVGMILDGRGACHQRGVPATVINIFTLANSFNALLWGSLFGCIVALILVLSQRIMTIGTAMEVRRPCLPAVPAFARHTGLRVRQAWTDGIKFNILEPMITLMFAWAIGAVITDLQGPAYLASALGQSLPAWIIPMLVQLLCFVMSFATGSAFGSMGIMFPLVIPLADEISHHDEAILMQVRPCASHARTSTPDAPTHLPLGCAVCGRHSRGEHLW